MSNDTLLQVEGLKVWYPVSNGPFREKGYVRAVDSVTFQVHKGEVFGIVGESGCGKSTLGRAICKLTEPTDGMIFLEGEDISNYTPAQMRPVRKKIQMVFQDPYASLDPRMTVFEIVAEPLRIHKLCADEEELKKRVFALLEEVGLAEYQAYKYPHEFSGGQRQRIGIARALAVDPSLIIADEPVSALDVSIQSQVLNLLNRLKKERGLTYIFVAHDLSVIEFISDRVGVMYLGDFVELADKDELYQHPLHPYTRALLAAIPVPDPRHKNQHIHLEGNVPSALNPPSGCKFRTRCSSCMEICEKEVPQPRRVGPNHVVCCHMYDKVQEDV